MWIFLLISASLPKHSMARTVHEVGIRWSSWSYVLISMQSRSIIYCESRFNGQTFLDISTVVLPTNDLHAVWSLENEPSSLTITSSWMETVRISLSKGDEMRDLDCIYGRCPALTLVHQLRRHAHALLRHRASIWYGCLFRQATESSPSSSDSRFCWKISVHHQLQSCVLVWNGGARRGAPDSEDRPWESVCGAATRSRRRSRAQGPERRGATPPRLASSPSPPSLPRLLPCCCCPPSDTEGWIVLPVFS